MCLSRCESIQKTSGYESERIKIVKIPQNCGINANSNAVEEVPSDKCDALNGQIC